MAQERTFNAVPPVYLTANGSSDGVLQITDTAGFYFGMQATLQNNLSNQLTVYIQRVVNNTTLWVGSKKSAPDHNVNLTAFTVASGSYISAAEQNKAAVPNESRLLAVYETDPVNAVRTVPVDSYGDHYTTNNPLPVTFEGSLSVTNVGIIGPAPDKNQLNVNNDGSINVNVIETPVSGNTVINQYNEVLSIASGITTTVVQYTTPGSIINAILERISVSGENIAKWTILLNSSVIDTRRTFYGNLNEYFEFTTGTSNGVTLNPGDNIMVQVIHNQPYTANFEGRIQILQIS